jgi:hypothetical protein
MVHKYVNAITEKGLMKPYLDIAKHKNIIDMSKLSNPESPLITFATIRYDDEIIDTLRSHDIYAIIPPFDDFVIKLNRKRFLYVKLIDSDIKNRTVKIKCDDYCGDRNDWICSTQSAIEISLGEHTEEGLSVSYEYSDTVSYEELLTTCLSEMDWTDEERQLWCDVFDVAPFDQVSHVSIKGMAEDCDRIETMILSEKKLLRLLSIVKSTCVQVDILENTAEGIKAHNDSLTAINTLTTYMQAITSLNYYILTSFGVIDEKDADKSDKNTERMIIKTESTDGKTQYTMGNIKIKSESEPRLHTITGG